MTQQIYSLLPLLVLFALMYFMMIRPQQQQAKKRQSMLTALKVGDDVVTIGGLHGKVEAIDDTTVLLRVSPTMQLKFNRSAVGAVRSEQ